MARIIWSPEAVANLEEICKYIAEDSEHYARLFAQKVWDLVETITAFPLAGRMVPEYQRQDLPGKGSFMAIASYTWLNLKQLKLWLLSMAPGCYRRYSKTLAWLTSVSYF